MNFHKKQRVQGFDRTLKQWLNATIVDIENKNIKLRWGGYGSEFDSWTERVRPSIEERALARNSIRKENFPNGGHPQNLQGKDKIFDTVQKRTWLVKENDPFLCEVGLSTF